MGEDTPEVVEVTLSEDFRFSLRKMHAFSDPDSVLNESVEVKKPKP